MMTLLQSMRLTGYGVALLAALNSNEPGMSVAYSILCSECVAQACLHRRPGREGNREEEENHGRLSE